MTWVDRITSPFRSNWPKLWVVYDNDRLLLNPAVSKVLGGRGFEIYPLTDTLALRFEYETNFVRRSDDDPAVIIQVSGTQQALPWDIHCAAKVIRLGIADMFPALDPTVVRLLSADQLALLDQAVSTTDIIGSLGRSVLSSKATSDFVLANVFRLNPGFLRSERDFWTARFDLFFSGAELPSPLADHLIQRAIIPDEMTAPCAQKLFSSRDAFIERVQHDWNVFATSLAVGGAPPSGLIPFTHARIRTSIDSMILDGTIQPVEVGPVADGTPSWVTIGLVSNSNDASELLRLRLESLEADIPAAGASHREWLGFAIQQADVLSTYYSLSPAQAAEREADIERIREVADRAFLPWLEASFGLLSSTSPAAAPTMVHQIAHYMALRRMTSGLRQALIVVDGLAVDQWVILERHLRATEPTLSIDNGACFAWLPTLTGVSRQAIFAAALPRTFPSTIGSTSSEEKAWRRYWSDHDIADHDVIFRKNIDTAEAVNALLLDIDSRRPKIIGAVVNIVDNMLHGAHLGKRGLQDQIRLWLDYGVWRTLMRRLAEAGYEIFVTADHGNVEAVGIGRPNEGVAAAERGERVRIYSNSTMREKGRGTVPGSLVLTTGGLPSNYLPLFAPFGAAFVGIGERMVAHGGLTIEEMVVPFARIKLRTVE